MSRTAPTWQLPPDLASDWHSLAQLIQDVSARQAVPCVSGSILDSAAWTSDDPTMQALAADACLDCPLFAQCRRYGDAHPKEAGVLGGTTWKERNAKA